MRIINMAKKYEVTPAQLCIRYIMELGLVALPKTENPEHMKNNADVSFNIVAEDVEALKNIKSFESYGEYSVFPVFSGK